MRTFRSSLLFVLVLFLAAPLTAQQGQQDSLVTLERLYATGDFRGEFFGPARWLPDGGYTTLEWSTQIRGRDIVRYDPETGERQVLVIATQLVPPDAGQPLWIADYEWSADASKLLIFTNTQRVWRSNTRGDYWVLDLETGDLKQLGADFDEASLMFAKFDPGAERVGYVYKNDIYVERLADATITRLTDDGSETIVNGTSDWVNEEEFFLRDCFRWSPDGRLIAYWQFDTSDVPWFMMINNTDSLYPYTIEFPYPKAGQTNSAIRVGVIDADGNGETRWVKLEGDPRNHYIPRMEWAASSDQVVIQYMNRLQNTNWLTLADVDDGRTRTVLTERDEAWLDVVDDLAWLDDGARFTWVSERDGWRHLYVASRDGDDIEPITPGDYDVVSVQQIDEEGGWVYFIASPQNPTQRYLYRVALDGGAAERLTPSDQPGTHSYQISDDARWAFHSYSRFGVPGVIELVRLPSHEVVRTLVDNADLRAKVEALDRGEFRFFRVDNGEGTMLDGYEMRPPNFDPSRRYPVLFHVYGEPWGQTVRDAWFGSQYLWHLMLTQQGYIVMSIDNRGTPAPRGREWRKVVYEKIGVIASADQAAAVREIGTWDYVDPNRIAIWGWSGGGSMSLNMIFRYPDLYGTAMAVAPVPDIRLYDTIYQERYMGLPQENVREYEQSSPVTFADRLRGNLLVIHGTGDDNVHYQGTERLINALIEAGKPFTVMPYPNRSHGIWEGRGTTLHVYTTLTEYLKDHVPPGPRDGVSE